MMVPIKDRQNSLYDLYKLLPTPILMHDRFYYPLIRYNFIAVHAVTQATLPLTQEQIDTFSTSILGTRYYHGPAIENHGNQKECIEALWTSNSTEIDTWCHLIATRNKEHAQPINTTAVLWITNKLIPVTVQCPNKPTSVRHINRTEIINVEANCKASSARLIFIPTPNIDTYFEIHLKNWTTDTTTNWSLSLIHI